MSRVLVGTLLLLALVSSCTSDSEPTPTPTGAATATSTRTPTTTPTDSPTPTAPPQSPDAWTRESVFPDPSSSELQVWLRGDIASDSVTACRKLIASLAHLGADDAEVVECAADYASIRKVAYHRDPDGALYVARVELLLRFRRTLREVTAPAPRACADLVEHMIRPAEETDDSDVIGTCWVETSATSRTVVIVGRIPIGSNAAQDALPRCLELVGLITSPDEATEDQACLLEY